MSIFLSLFLGLVQGITEFLPVSSSGHLSIFQNMFRMDYSGDNHLLLEMLLHLGTLVSIIAVYWAEIKTMISDGLEFLRLRSDSNQDEPVTLKPPARALLLIMVGTAPMLIAAFFLGKVSLLFGNTAFVGFALIVTGGLLFVSDKYINKGNKTEKTMTILDAILIGLAQAVAILPGLSRSGSTVAVGLSRGLNGNFAERFSLLLSIPAVFGGMVVSLYKAIREGTDFSLLPIYLAGFVVAAVVGFFAIQLIRRLMSSGSFGKFAYYCWGVGALTMILSLVL